MSRNPEDKNETVMQRLEELIPGRENHTCPGLEVWTNLILGPFHVCLWLAPCPLMPVLGTGFAPNAEPLGWLRIKAEDLKQVVMISLCSSETQALQPEDDCV